MSTDEQEDDLEDLPLGTPWRETYTDHAGKKRVFEILVEVVPTGFAARAREVRKTVSYEFSSLDPASDAIALYRLRQKISRGIATRYLTKHGELTHDEARGHVTFLNDDDGVGFVIDGRAVTLEDLRRILSAREGFDFELRFRDSLD